MVNVRDLARDDDNGGENHEGDNRKIVEQAIKGTRLFSVAILFRARRVSCEDISRRHKTCYHGTVCPQKHDGI